MRNKLGLWLLASACWGLISCSSSSTKMEEPEKEEIEDLKQRMKALEKGTEDTIAAINDLSEDTRKELDDIYLALSQLADKQKQITRKSERKPIGFAQYKKEDKS